MHPRRRPRLAIAGAICLVVIVLSIYRMIYVEEESSVISLKGDSHHHHHLVSSSSSSHALGDDDEEEAGETVAPNLPPPTPHPSSSSPTSSSPTSSTPTPPLWEPPRPDSPVRGQSGDYEWRYPTVNSSSSKDYAQRIFTEQELTPCPPWKLCCAVGAVGSGGGFSTNGCGLNMEFMAEFHPTGQLPILSLVDALVAWSRLHPTRHAMQMTFIGDSVTGQIFTAAVCELARNARVTRVTHTSKAPAKQDNPFNQFQHSLDFQEAHVSLQASQVNFTLLFIRQYRLTTNQRVIPHLLRDADVVWFGWGLHYAMEHEMLRMAASRAVNATLQHRDPPLLLWVGSPKQHFNYHARLGDKVEDVRDGRYIAGRRSRGYCGPVARFPPGHDLAKPPINQMLYKHLSSSLLNVSTSWFQWGRSTPTPSSRQHVHFIDLAELQSPFYRNYPGYNANRSMASSDCTHFCWAPNLMQPLWTAAAQLMGANNNNNNTEFPAGTHKNHSVIEYVVPAAAKHSKSTVAAYHALLSPAADAILRAIKGEWL